MLRIAPLLGVGLLLRLFLAYLAFPGSGFETDLATFNAWAQTLAANGPGRFYATAGFADYPPAFLYVLWLLGMISGVLAPLFGATPSEVTASLIKLPAIAADIGVAYLLYRLVRGWVAGPERAERLGTAAAAIYLFNPVVWYDSAIWGQVDAIGALVILGAIALLLRGYSEGAAGLTVLAGLVKPQFGLVLLAIVSLVLVRRHLLSVGSGPRPANAPRQLEHWLVDVQGPWRLVTSAVVAAAVLVAVIAPFSLDLFGLVRLLGSTAGGYPWLSVNAYNPWALTGSGGADPLAAGGGWSRDDLPVFGPLSGFVIGVGLLAASFIYGGYHVLTRHGRWPLLVAVIFFALAFFVLPTRVHERYLFPVFAFLPLVAIVDRRWMVATVVLSAASLINLHGVLTTPLYGTANIENLALGDTFRTLPWALLSVAGHVAVFVFAAVELHRVRDAFAVLSETARARAAAAPPSGAVAEAPAGLVGMVREAAVDPLRRRLAIPAVRADLSSRLAFEPPGRLDRLDLVVVALVIVSALMLRTWRLEQPYEMHFDEVYHARTATEFLQDWGYRIPHDIYEYTHPHLAKYLIALGIVNFGNNRVTGQTQLPGPVSDAAIEPRWTSLEETTGRAGDRLYVATGSWIDVYDLANRSAIARLESPAMRVAVDESNHALYAADAGGSVFRVDTAELDDVRAGSRAGPPTPARFGDLGAAPVRLAVTRDGANLIAIVAGDRVVSMSTESGSITGDVEIPAASAVVPLDNIELVVAEPGVIGDTAAVARALASALEDDSERLRELLSANVPRVVVAAFSSDEHRSAVRRAIDAGEIEGVELSSQAAVAITGRSGVTIVDGPTLDRLGSVGLPTARGLALMREGLDKPTLYVANGQELTRIEVASDQAPRAVGSSRMPGAIRDVRWNPATGLIHVLGDAPVPDGAATTEASAVTGTTIYVVEPHGNAVFADARLPFDPAVWLIDAQHDRPSEDREEAIVAASSGALAVVDVGRNAFAWRFPGVLAGAAMAGVIYVLGRLLFRRRSVAIIGALLVLVDGMFFVNARIAMNDAYVSLFIVAAVTAFAALYLDHWRGRAGLLLGPPLVGALLGLALASKWVGAYAIGGLVLLVLLRSAVGRLIALAGMIAMTGVLGYLAILTSPGVEDGQRNVLFLVVLVILTTALAVALVIRPVRFTPGEVRTAFLGLLAAGGLLVTASTLGRRALPADGLISPRNLLLAGALLLLAAVAIQAGPLLAARLRRTAEGPSDEPEMAPPSPAPTGWTNPGWARGIPWAWALGCIIVVPLVVYILSFVPWAQPWHPGGPRLTDGWPLIGTWPRGHEGQTFLDLQRAMYEYHNNLRATHAASSPWWAWPLDLKPVWFYSDSFGQGQNGIIYDAGNLVAFWLAIPAVAWASWQAWRRRSLSLTVLVVMIAALWLPWARIDRATFQYHIFTSLPFSFLALAYFLAELWHGPSARTWALARVAGAVALLLAPILWLSRPVLCALADTERVVPGGQACGAVTEQFVLTERWAVAVAIAAIGLVAVGWQLYSARAEEGSAPESAAAGGRWVALTALGTVVVTTVALLRLSDRAVLSMTIGQGPPYLLALVALVVLSIPALFILEARDPRRFAVAAIGAAVFWFVAFYPYISGLPVPSGIAGWYQTLPLPTWNYDFQFAVNTDPAFQTPNLLTNGLAIAAGVTALCLAAMYTANAWRIEFARRRYERAREAVGGAEA